MSSIPIRSLFAGALCAACLLPPAAFAEVPQPSEIARISPAGNYLAARQAGQTRDMAAAAAYYRGALRADPRNPELVERTFLAVLATGDIDKALPLAERLVGFDRSHRIARLTLAVRALQRGRFATARTHLTQSVHGPIADLTNTLLGAWALAGSGDAKTAIDNIDRLQGPDWYVAFKDLHAGLILDFAGRGKDALQRLERAYGHDPNALRTADAYARRLARSDGPTKALEVYEEFSKVLPDHPLIRAAVADLKAGRRLAPLVRSVQAGAAEVLFGLGTAMGRQGGEDLGLVYLQLALHSEPAHPLALLALGDLHEALRKPNFAIEAFARVPDSSPLKRNAEIQRALNLNALERQDEALELLERLSEKHPDDLETLIALGNVLRVAKRYEDAAAVYSKAIAQVAEPEHRHWTVFYFRAICYERAKQWPLAEKDFQKALVLFPDQPDVLNYLGYSWIDMGIHLDEGLELVKRAVEQRPNSGYIVDSLGWAYYRLGRYEEAVRELERAIELRPQDAVINDHLGDAYWKVGRKLEARFQWRHALDLDPEEEEIPKIEAKLKNGLPDENPPPRAGSVKEPDKGG